MEDATKPVTILSGATSVVVGVAIHLTKMVTAVTVSHHVVIVQYHATYIPRTDLNVQVVLYRYVFSSNEIHSGRGIKL